MSYLTKVKMKNSCHTSLFLSPETFDLPQLTSIEHCLFIILIIHSHTCRELSLSKNDDDDDDEKEKKRSIDTMCRKRAVVTLASIHK